MCGCLSLIFGSFAPRLTLFFVMLFTDRISQAFDGRTLTAFLGWLFLPFTELFFVVLTWWNGSVQGFSWFIVALGFVIDFSSYASGYRYREDVRR
jgi:hypothetical protein